VFGAATVSELAWFLEEPARRVGWALRDMRERGFVEPVDGPSQGQRRWPHREWRLNPSYVLAVKLMMSERGRSPKTVFRG
jgi:hypothetical protein